MASTTGTGQVLNSSPLVERILTGQNNQAQHAGQYAAEQQARKLAKEKEAVHKSDSSEHVTIQSNAEKDRKGKGRAKRQCTQGNKPADQVPGSEDEAPPVKHIDVRA